MKADSTPKRPLHPFFSFLKDIRAKNEGKESISSRAAGNLWNELSVADRKAYYDVYRQGVEVFEKYLEEVEGIKPRPPQVKYDEKLSPMGHQKPDHFRAKRIRAVCGSSRKILPMDKKIYRALGRVLVPPRFITTIRNSL